MAARKSYSAHCVVALIAISLPFLLSLQGLEKPDLTGLVVSDEKLPLTAETWFSGEYQESADDYYSDHWPLKEVMVRLNNQFYYKAFNQIRVNGFVLGRQNYVYSESYIFSAFGDDLVQQEKISSLLTKARVVQDSLGAHGVNLLLVYAPGKGMGCREFIEDKYVHPYSETNHSRFLAKTKELAISHLDLYSMFERLKPSSKFPLFPKYGHHWSYYGECLAVDTIVKHLGHLTGRELPLFVYDSLEISDTARSRDADVLRSMNLYSNPPQDVKLAYPKVKFGIDTSANPVRVLTIGDSYWYGPVYMGIGQACFGNGQFWYYYNKVVPAPNGVKTEVWELDLKREIESYNAVMLVYSDGNLPIFGNAFINDAYEMYTSPATYRQRVEKHRIIQSYAKQIREIPALLKKSTALSRETGITLDSAIRYDAMKMAGMIKTNRR